MKKWLLVPVLLIGILLAGMTLDTKQGVWTTIGTATVKDDAPAVDALDYASVAALTHTTIYTPPTGDNAVELRFTGDTDTDVEVVNIYAARGGGDYFSLVCILTMEVGTQQMGSATTLAVHSISVGTEMWLKEITVIDGGGADRVARITLDLCGYSKWAFVPTTVTGTLTIQASGF